MDMMLGKQWASAWLPFTEKPEGQGRIPDVHSERLKMAGGKSVPHGVSIGGKPMIAMLVRLLQHKHE